MARDSSVGLAFPVRGLRAFARALARVGVLALALAAPLVFDLGGTLARAQVAPVRSVPAVDLARYVGKWYEIAAFPMFFQRKCIGDTTAEYSLRPDGDIAVVNRCRTEDGFDEAVGKAWAVEGSGNSRLKVSFFWPFRADYWIIGLDEDYRWAVVGNPSRKYLWVLSRTPRLPREQLERALQAAAGQGYDLGQLKHTDQGRGPVSR